jgi:hypothetical protein
MGKVEIVAVRHTGVAHRRVICGKNLRSIRAQARSFMKEVEAEKVYFELDNTRHERIGGIWLCS